MAFNPSGTPNAIPIDERWRAFYKLVLEGGLGSEVGIGRSATLWRTVDSSRVSEYETRRMTDPPPSNALIHAGDVVMSPILGGPAPLPCTYWTKNGKAPPDVEALNPSYAICMGQTGQVHFLQECVGIDQIRIWASFVDSVQINLQTQRVELFPYADFPVEDCGGYTRFEEPPSNRFVYAYCPLRRVKPETPSVAITTMFEGGAQFTAMFG